MESNELIQLGNVIDLNQWRLHRGRKHKHHFAMKAGSRDLKFLLGMVVVVGLLGLGLSLKKLMEGRLRTST